MPRSVHTNAAHSLPARYSSRAPSGYVSSTSMESRKAMNVMSSASGERTTTANGSPSAAREGMHHPFSSVLPSATLMLAEE